MVLLLCCLGLFGCGFGLLKHFFGVILGAGSRQNLMMQNL